MNPLPGETITSIVRAALAEDIGKGDITTETVIPGETVARAVIMAKESCVLAGLPLVKAVFNELNPNIVVKSLVQDGDKVKTGLRVCELAGPARAVLTGERTALNFLQRLSGIATLTRQFAEAVSGTNAKILDTRKTTPGLRIIEKYAVAVGGGENHRMGLYDAVMIKDNHRKILEAMGPQAVKKAVAGLRKKNPQALIIIEAGALSHVKEALEAGVDHILLDNMEAGHLREAVSLIRGRAKTEASGRVRLGSVAEVAATGVDYISVGAITHSAGAIDFSMEVVSKVAG